MIECGKMLKKGGYKIKVLNTINFAKSMHYNPFAYLRSEKDILKLVNTIIVNTKGADCPKTKIVTESTTIYRAENNYKTQYNVAKKSENRVFGQSGGGAAIRGRFLGECVLTVDIIPQNLYNTLTKQIISFNEGFCHYPKTGEIVRFLYTA